MFGRDKLAVLMAEFLGTGVLTMLVLSVQRSTIGVPFFIAAAAGLTVMMATMVFGEKSGAHLNPAITIGMWTVRKIGTLSGIVYIAAQMLGAWAAYYMYTYLVGSRFTSIGGHYSTKVLVAESLGAFIFAIGWAAASYTKTITMGARSALIGLSYMLGIIAVSSASLGLLNPALALGVKAWVLGSYVLGPVIGAVVGFNLYSLLFAEGGAMIAGMGVGSPMMATTAKASSKPAAKKATRSTKKTTRRKK